jgi:hypothetical protein
MQNNFGSMRDQVTAISLIWSLGDSRSLKLDPATGQLLPPEVPSSSTAAEEMPAPRFPKKKLSEKSEKASKESDPWSTKGEDGKKKSSEISKSKGKKKEAPAKKAQGDKKQKRPGSEEAQSSNAKKRARVEVAAPASDAVEKTMDVVTEVDITADLSALRAAGDCSVLNLAMFGGEIPGMLATQEIMVSCKELAGDPIHWASAMTAEESMSYEKKGEKVKKLLTAAAAYLRFRELRNTATGYYLPP